MSHLLVLDVGNTSIVLGVFHDDELVASWRLSTSSSRTEDEYGVLARQLVSSVIDSPVSGAAVASVVPPLTPVIKLMVHKYFDVDPLAVEPGIKTGLSIKTENPMEIGADRIANAVAAHHTWGGPTIIVDFGTATTFDLVSANGEYRGGLIAPGLDISADALFSRASRLPRVEIRKPEQVIGTNTVASMQSGLYYGYLAMVEGILSRMREEVGEVRQVVGTGAAAPLIMEDTRSIDTVSPQLTLEGLRLIYDRNSGVRGRRRR